MKRLFVVSIVLLMTLALASVTFAAGGGAPRVTTLSGAEEVSTGDPDGSGFASIRLNVGQERVCWEVSFSDISAPFAAHIHNAPAGANGGVVVPLNPIESGCTTADPGLIQAIIDYPEQYYVNVHNAEYPAGAIRGQLSNRGQSK